MEELDKKDWDQFREKNSTRVTRQEVELVSQLHAKYFKHSYYIPCSCSPKTLQGWVDDLNRIYESE